MTPKARYKSEVKRPRHEITAQQIAREGAIVLFTISAAGNCVIPDSHGLAVELGHGAVFSGYIIGLRSIGDLLVMVVFFFLVKNCPERLWRNGFSMKLAGNIVTFLAASIWVYGVVVGMDDRPLEHSSRSSLELTAICVLLSRLIQGVGHALVYGHYELSVARIVALPYLPATGRHIAFFNYAGYTLSPMMPALVHILNPCLTDG